MKIMDVEVAMAIIAHEAVPCFCGKEQKHSSQPKHLTSCTGGRFFGTPGEPWPVSADGQPLVPWLQVVPNEMDRLNGAFANRKAVCFYIRQDFSDCEAISSFDGSDFVVREYGPNDDLVPLVRPKTLTAHSFHRVIWEKSQDYPSISKYCGLFDAAVYASVCEIKNFKYENRSGIKIGGWPTPVQQSQEYPGSSDLQIDMTKNFMYGDSGIGYLSRKGSAWYVIFECC
jgi:uncharacterized protein YwqG